MKHRMLPFDAEKLKKNSKYRVVTRSGRNARIICWDSKFIYEKKNHPVLALVENYGGGEDAYHYDMDGKYYGRYSSDSDYDLFMVSDDEMELNDWEDAVQKLMLKEYPYGVNMKELKKVSRELLELSTGFVSWNDDRDEYEYLLD